MVLCCMLQFNREDDLSLKFIYILIQTVKDLYYHLQSNLEICHSALLDDRVPHSHHLNLTSSVARSSVKTSNELKRFRGVMFNFWSKDLENFMLTKVSGLGNLRNTRILSVCKHAIVYRN